MTDQLTEMTDEERADLDRILARIARSGPAIEQALDVLEQFADSGNLAALGGLFEEFDDNFNALTRPDLMGMVGNLMMVIGVLSQLPYQPFFDLAMRTPGAFQEAYPAFRERTKPLGIGEMVRLMRSPEMAAALQLMVALIAAQRDGQPPG